MELGLITKIVAIILLTFFCLAIIAYNIYTFFRMFSKKAPYVGSFSRHLKIIKNELQLKKNATLLDLGCGDGKAMRFFRKYYDLGQIDGYEINLFAIFWARVINLFVKPKNLHFHIKDFKHADLSQYDYVYVYLLPDQLAHIEKWLFDGIRPDTIIISNSFRFSQHTAFQQINNSAGKASIFLYKN